MARTVRTTSRAPRTADPDPLHAGSLHRTLLRLLMVLCVLLAAVTWLTAITARQLLPTNTPVLLSVNAAGVLYGLPMVTTAIALAMLLLYSHPRYAALPGTLLLELLPPRERAAVTAIVQANLVPVLTLVNLLLAYLHYSVISVALGNRARLDALPLAALLGLLLLTATFYAVVSTRMVTAIVRTVRRA